MTSPLCIDLYCGLGGWAEGFLSEGYRVKGFDIEAHDYGTGGYPGELILRDVRSIHGSEFKDAAVIVGSSPCQEFSYRAMPWKRAKALGPPYLGMELFQAQFRIQREACEAAGRYIPMVVENVRGAQKWVGRARWHFGSVLPLGRSSGRFDAGDDAIKQSTGSKFSLSGKGSEFPRQAFRWSRGRTRQIRQALAIKNNGGLQKRWFAVAHNTTSGKGLNPVSGRKVGGDWFGTYAEQKASGTISTRADTR